MAKSKRILVCPMDWGLGHATRIVPVVNLLREAGAEVVFGADNKPLAFLQQRFPEAEWVKLPGFSPRYYKKGALPLKMAFTIPEMLREAGKAHRLLEKIVTEKKIDAVFSDNRYELWSEKVPAVFMTHQLTVLLPGILATGRPPVRKMIYGFIKKFDELWIPDFEKEPSLSGKLSHVRKMPLKNSFFIGPLSRFEGLKLPDEPRSEKYDVLCLLSGPEPQRTVFEEILIGQLKNSLLRSVILSGNPDKTKIRNIGNMEIRPHAGDVEIARLILSSQMVICRSGYSSLMDLAALGKKAAFVPTPGQPEQEYLAQRMKQKGFFYAASQKKFQIEKAFDEIKHYTGLHIQNDYRLLRERIQNLLQKI